MVKLKLTFLLGLCLPVMCWAQLNRGTIAGVVTDSSGAIVPGAAISALHVETGTTVATTATDSGNYTLPALSIGTYRVSYEAPGFKRLVRDKVGLSAGATLGLDVVLEVGSVTDSVMVEAQASPVETETTRVATTVNTKLVQELPILVNGSIRSVVSLALIAPETKVSGGQLRIGGGQGAGWEMMMDGMPLSSASSSYQDQRAPLASVPIDAIAEFTVESNGMKAEFGRASGAVTFATKSGTNQLHGTLFEELRNNAMDARGFFAPTTPVLKQHDFGLTIGGPVVIPKIYNGRNKTFFYGSYQGFRNRAGSNPQYLTVPTAANYEGDFSGWTRNGVPVPIYDPASTRPRAGGGYERDVFPNGIIPKSRFSEVAKRYIALRPADMLPNTTGRNAFGDPVQNYFRSAGSQVNPWNKGSLKVDHQLSAADRLSVLWLKGRNENTFGVDGPAGLPEPFNGSSITRFNSTSYRVSWDHMFSSRIINTARVSYQKESQWLATLNSVDPEDGWNSILKIPNTPGPDRALPALTFTAYNGWSGSSWGGDGGGNFNLSNDVTIISGKHSIKTGFFYTHDRWDGFGQHRPNGSYGFSYQATGVPGDNSQNSGNAFASFLLGYVSSGGIETPRSVRQIWNYTGGYLQDDWRVTSNLTINAGLRYEYTAPIRGGAYSGLSSWEDLSSGTLDGFSNFDPSVPNPGAGGRLGAMVFSGSGPGRLNDVPLFDGYPWGFGPRLGLVYRMGGGLILRASGGRTFAAVKTTGGSTHFDGFILNTNYTSQDNSINDFWTMLDQGVPWGSKGLPPSAASLPFIDPTLANDREVHFWQRSDSGRPGTYDMWTLDIQKSLGPTMSLTAGYSGSKGTHLSSALSRYNQIEYKYMQQYGRTLLNSGFNSAGARAAGIAAPYPGFGSSTAHTVQRALSPFPQYTNVMTNGGQPASIGERAGNSTYHALILKLDRRYSNGLTVLSSYVFSKQLADSDSAAIINAGPLDHYNRKLEKSLSGVDQTHVARLTFAYDLPFGKGKAFSFNRGVNALISDWNISAFLSYESGFPDSVGSGYSPIGTGSRVFITSYDNWRAPIAGEKFDPAVDLWYNKSAFNQGISVDRLNSEWGNATRNNPKLRSPWNLNENVTLGRTFRFTERINFQLRGEAFNVFNRTRWGGASSTFTATDFGRVTTQANLPRKMQIGMKLNF